MFSKGWRRVTATLLFALICISGLADAYISKSAQDNVVEMVQVEQMDDAMEDVMMAFEDEKDEEEEQEEEEEEDADCSCTNLACKCCQDVNLPKIHLQKKFCVQINYSAQSGDVIVSLLIGDKEVWKQEFPVGRPPSACIGIPGIPAKVCLGFYDFHIDSKIFTGCARVAFRLMGQEIAKVKIGCFRIKIHDSNIPVHSTFIRLLESGRI